MRIFVCRRVDGAFGYITDAWINALSMVSEIEVGRWDGTIDSWDRFKPDLFIGASGHRQRIPNKASRSGCKVAIHVNPYGPINVHPNINESTNAIDWVVNQEPDAVFGYGFEKDRHYWSWWDRDGIHWVPMACAGDATKFNPQIGNHKKDVVYLGGRWAYKAKNIDPYLFPVLRDRDLSCVVFGWGEWPSDLTVTNAADYLVPSIVGSAKVGPCIAEPHTIRYGIDIPERVFKVSLSGTIAIHDPVANICDVLESTLIADSPHAYHETIKSIVKNKSHTILDCARKQYDEVFNKHTYHHRLSVLLKFLGFVHESQSLLHSLKSLKVDF